MLSVQNLEVVYQDVILVLRGISFEIPKGIIVALLGSNGSGKTTVIRSITGLLDVQNGDITKGKITVDGDDITNLNPSKIVEKGIAQVMEGRRIFSELSVVHRTCFQRIWSYGSHIRTAMSTSISSQRAARQHWGLII